MSPRDRYSFYACGVHRLVGPAALLIVVTSGSLAAGQSAVPTRYDANTTRTAIVEPPLLPLGPAGSQFVDPAFGSKLSRVTDANTHPSLPGMSWVTPSAAHQLAWNSTSDRFVVRSVSGAHVAYNFDAPTVTATRITATGSGGDGLVYSQVEPQFSFRSPHTLYVTRQASSPLRPVVRRFDFNTFTYTDILDLAAIASMPSPSYARALVTSASEPEMVSLLFGGAQQDLDFKVAAFEVASPEDSAAVLDSMASTITRAGTVGPTSIPLGFQLHHQWLDLSGRYVLLFPVSGSFPSPLPYFVWDLQTDGVARVDRFPGGHEALGYGWHVNQDCCAASAYDGAQWQLRALSSPTVTTDLITPVLSPTAPFLADHTSWNNAQAGARVPILSSLYRYGTVPAPWRAWDDEIIAIQTDASPAGATVWRFAHHRSAVADDGGAGQYFWYLPRATISPNGRFALFTSNWEKTLGASITGDPGGDYRTDVFVIALGTQSGEFTDDPLMVGVTVVKSAHVNQLRVRIDALRARFGVGAFAWNAPFLSPGMSIRSAHLYDLRTALQDVFGAAGLPAPAYTDPAITVIRAAHIQELRSAVTGLEPR